MNFFARFSVALLCFNEAFDSASKLGWWPEWLLVLYPILTGLSVFFGLKQRPPSEARDA